VDSGGLDERAREKLKEWFQSDDAHLKSHQEKAYSSIMNRSHHTLHVAPTGSGKTLPVLLAASMIPENNKIVFLLPFRVIYSQVEEICIRYGISYEKWGGALSNRQARVVLTSAENYGHPEFKKWLKSLSKSKELHAVCIDEASVVVEDSNWRTAFGHIKTCLLELEGVRFHLMTATCPPSYEESLWNAIGLKDTAKLKVIRIPTIRDDILWIRMPIPETPEQLAEIYNTIEMDTKNPNNYPEETDRAIMFCNNRQTTEDWASRLNCPFIHGGLNEDQRKRALETWTEPSKDQSPSPSRVLVANKAAFYGMDYPHVRVTYHIDIPDSMIELVQAAGRGGRDKKGSTAFLLVRAPKGNGMRKVDEIPSFGGRTELAKTLRQDICINACFRAFLDEGKYLVKGCVVDEMRCYGCRKNMQEPGGEIDVSSIKVEGVHEDLMNSHRQGGANLDYHVHNLTKDHYRESIEIGRILLEKLWEENPSEARTIYDYNCMACYLVTREYHRHRDKICPNVEKLVQRVEKTGFVDWSSRKLQVPSGVIHGECLMSSYDGFHYQAKARECINPQLPQVICLVAHHPPFFESFREWAKVTNISDKNSFLSWSTEVLECNYEYTNAFVYILPWIHRNLPVKDIPEEWKVISSESQPSKSQQYTPVHDNSKMTKYHWEDYNEYMRPITPTTPQYFTSSPTRSEDWTGSY
jgi:superfamily II DNA helicase RecQ